MKIIESKFPLTKKFTLISTKENVANVIFIRRNAMEKYAEKLADKNGKKWQNFLERFQVSKKKTSFNLDWLKYKIPEDPAETIVFTNGFFNNELSTFSEKKIIASELQVVENSEKMSLPFASVNVAYSLNPIEILVKKKCKLRIIFIADDKNKISLPSVFLNVKNDIKVDLEEVQIAEKHTILSPYIYGNFGKKTKVNHSVFLLSEGAFSPSHFMDCKEDSEYNFYLKSPEITSMFFDQKIELNAKSKAKISCSFPKYKNIEWSNSAIHKGNDSTSNVSARIVGAKDSSAQIRTNAVVPLGVENTIVDQDLKGLFLDENIKMELTPNMQISSEKSSAHHGASMEKLSKAKLFYLQSRGLEKSVAEKLFIDAFVGEKK
ncbi:MAG: SufD family Fe-S cluster assembly protein [Alphaproteobacteria bacterium]